MCGGKGSPCGCLRRWRLLHRECGCLYRNLMPAICRSGQCLACGHVTGRASARPGAPLCGRPRPLLCLGAATSLQSKSRGVVSEERAWERQGPRASRGGAAFGSEPCPPPAGHKARCADAARAAPVPRELGRAPSWPVPPERVLRGADMPSTVAAPPRQLLCPPPAVGDTLGSPSNSDWPGAWGGSHGSQFSCSALLLVQRPQAAPSWSPSPRMVPRPPSGSCVAISPQGPRGGYTERPPQLLGRVGQEACVGEVLRGALLRREGGCSSAATG